MIVKMLQNNGKDLKNRMEEMQELTHLTRINGSDGKESACNVGDPGAIPGSGRSPGEGNGNPLQYSCLEDPLDREEPDRLSP